MYIPGQAFSQLSSPPQEQHPVQEPSFIAPDMQKLVDLAAAKVADSEAIKTEEKKVPATEEDWKWLREECRRRLKASEELDLGLTFEQRGKLYQYRQELRDLLNKVGPYWTPSSIEWPAWPNM